MCKVKSAGCSSGYDDDFIKLYDLTTLCSHLADDVTTNPFTVPVGILLYRVARNMRMHGRQKSNIVRSLLEKCLLLLDAVKHAQVTHCALLLSWIFSRIVSTYNALLFYRGRLPSVRLPSGFRH